MPRGRGCRDGAAGLDYGDAEHHGDVDGVDASVGRRGRDKLRGGNRKGGGGGGGAREEAEGSPALPQHSSPSSSSSTSSSGILVRRGLETGGKLMTSADCARGGNRNKLRTPVSSALPWVDVPLLVAEDGTTLDQPLGVVAARVQQQR